MIARDRLILVLASLAAGVGQTALAATALAQANTAPDPGYRPPTNAVAIASARRAATEKLDDPASARVTDLKRKAMPNARGEKTDVVCGMLDSKDSSGKYTGPKQFVFFVQSSEVTLGHGDETDRTVVRNFCVGFPAGGRARAPQ